MLRELNMQEMMLVSGGNTEGDSEGEGEEEEGENPPIVQNEQQGDDSVAAVPPGTLERLDPPLEQDIQPVRVFETMGEIADSGLTLIGRALDAGLNEGLNHPHDTFNPYPGSMFPARTPTPSGD